MGIFRLWQPHTDEYMLAWNGLVAMHTIQQLSAATKAKVYEHYHTIVALNRLNPMHDLAAGVRYDPFWLAFTMADLGISPLLGPKPAKWFYVADPRRARNVLFDSNRSDEIGDKVLRDIQRKHGVLINPDSLTPE